MTETEDKGPSQPLLDWTCDDAGVSNSSAQYLDIAAHVELLIRSDAHQLIQGHADATARLIVSNLAHKFGMAPATKGS